jgi:hypothetical protein
MPSSSPFVGSWRHHDIPAQLHAVVAALGGFVAIGADAPLPKWVSRDGVSWALLKGAPAASIIRSDGTTRGALAVGCLSNPSGEHCERQAIWRTADGTHWRETAIDLGPDLDSIDDVMGNGGRFIAIGHRCPILASAPGISLASVDASGGLTAAVCQQRGVTLISLDGSSWQPKDLVPDAAGATFQRIEPAGHGFLILGGIASATGSGFVPTLWTSINGLIWTSGMPLPAEAASVAFQSGLGYVAVGSTESNAAAAWISSDGRQWRAVPDEGPFPDAAMDDVASTERGPVGVGQGGEPLGLTVWTSSDGTTWSRTGIGPGSVALNAMSVAVQGRTVVVAGNPDGDYGKGRLWTTMLVP